jgi:haloalkane dehalogenase
MTSKEVIERHEAAGRRFDGSFALDEGSGDAVVCIHGVPTSSFLYRKLVRELAQRGLRGVAFDLPGLGLADRPADFDYSWTGLGRFAVSAVDALGLDRFHLVVHDIGGPVGFELAAAAPDRVLSLTALNTLIRVDGFKRPWSMEPFARRRIGEVYLATMTKPAFRTLFRMQGLEDRSATPKEEIDAYFDLLKRGDGGKAFLKIMRGFERTPEKQALYRSTLRDVPYPVQVVWGERDPALSLKEHLDAAPGLEPVHRLPAKHFLPEDQAPAIAERVAAIAG